MSREMELPPFPGVTPRTPHFIYYDKGSFIGVDDFV